jgi:subtilase family serine protease
MTGRIGASTRHFVGATAVAMVLMAGTVVLAGTGGVSASPPAWSNANVCAAAPHGYANCNAIVHVYSGRGRPGGGTPAGYGPAQLRSAYNLTTNPSGHPVVAIVDADGYSNAFKDLTTYRNQYGLPAISKCTSNLTASLCFDQVSQTGATTSLPSDNASWDEEQALDVDMVSASCPQCSILLVDADSASNANLATGVNEAVALGAGVVSNSYGGQEDTTPSDVAAYSHAGVAIVVSSGDNGYIRGSSSPADYPSVIAAGGTSLTSVSPRTESAWSGSGSYCSQAFATPSWQAGLTTGCKMRAVADVSSDADPNTGVAVSYGGGWWVFGGTSVSSPFISGVIATAGNWASFGTSGPSYSYAHSSGLKDITSGSNGHCLTVICKAGTGWDGPTGLGAVNGTNGL